MVRQFPVKEWIIGSIPISGVLGRVAQRSEQTLYKG